MCLLDDALCFTMVSLSLTWLLLYIEKPRYPSEMLFDTLLVVDCQPMPGITYYLLTSQTFHNALHILAYPDSIYF